jgi:hypothetical protein
VAQEWMNKSTKFVTIRKDVDLGIKLYPVAFGNWDKRKNSYHGQAIGTGLVPNQIYVNKQFAMVMKWLMDMAFGKVAFDATRVQAWSNKIGEAIPIQGEITGAVQQLMPGQMNSIVLEVIDRTMNLTKELVGASDAALGDIKPENTSAIIAVQQSASVPLENVKANLYQFVEDQGLIWLDFMLSKYDLPRQLPYDVKGKTKLMEFSGQDFQDVAWSINVDVGPSSYWSEIASMQTLDNLLSADRITFIQYLERVKEGYIPKKDDLIEEKRKEMEAQANQPPAPASLPSEAISYRDLPPAGKIQLAAKAGIQLTADDFIVQQGGMPSGLEVNQENHIPG